LKVIEKSKVFKLFNFLFLFESTNYTLQKLSSVVELDIEKKYIFNEEIKK